MAAHRPSELPLGIALDANGGVCGYGVRVGGIPVGDDGYVQQCLAQKSAKVVSKIQHVSDMLRPLHLQSLHCATYYGLTSLFDHVIQHCYHRDALRPARDVDAAVDGVLEICLGQAVMLDRFAMERMRLPARMYGGGMRSCADLAPAAFVGAVCRVLPRMLDHAGAQGITIPGFMPQLTALFGQGSFDSGAEDVRYAALLQSDVRLAGQLRDTWQGLQAEVGERAGMLNEPARGAGRGSQSVQRDLTQLREGARFQRLDVALRALPGGDMRRAAWTNLDGFSTTWVSVWPCRACRLNNREFAEVAARYCGLPSPACQPLVGQPI
eukprot:774339-Karenia_brevis.AAC.1